MSPDSPWVLVMLALLLLWPAHNAVLAVFAWWRPRAHRSDRAEGLRFWIVIPALNEERVVAATVASALALDSPEHPVRVLVVDDGSTDGTPGILAAIGDPRLHVLRRELPEARKGKGEALNAAYRLVRDWSVRDGVEHQTIIGVIDGDGRGAPGMLQEVAGFFASRSVGAVQCRVRIHNRDNVLAFMQDLEFSCVADASQSLRDVLGSVDLGGNGQFVRVTTLMRFGDEPWSSCLVEDLELGLRLHLEGVGIRYATNAVITQQALTDPRRLLRQRARWGQGNLQCLRYVPKLVKSPAIGTFALLDFLYYLLTPWLVAPISLAVLGMLGLSLTGPFVLSATLFWASAFLGPGLLWGLVHRIKFGDEPVYRTVLAGLCYPLFLVIGIAATWRAFGRHLARRNGWAKTERHMETDRDAVLA